MVVRPASASGTVAIGGVLPVARMGFGALRITGPDLWGDPHDRAGAHHILRRAVDLGVTLIDTADSYGPHTSETLIREALHPYAQDLVIATKGGLLRPDPRTWVPLGRPEYLIQQAKLSARRLGVDQIALWQLHRIDPNVPADEQFDAIRSLIDDGVIRFAGLSEVGVEEITAAQRYFPVATVQNLYNLAERRSEAALDYCAANGIVFLPFYPLGGGALVGERSGARALADIAARRGATSGQLALAWLLRRSPVIALIPGTCSPAHLDENVAAAQVALTDDECLALDAIGREIAEERAQRARESVAA